MYEYKFSLKIIKHQIQMNMNIVPLQIKIIDSNTLTKISILIILKNKLRILKKKHKKNGKQFLITTRKLRFKDSTYFFFDFS